MIKKIWDKLTHWSGWKAAGTIFLARLTSLAGLVLAGVQGIDWSRLASMDFSNAAANKQLLIGAGIMFLYGISLEVTRRRGATDL